MKCKILSSGKNTKMLINLSYAESAHSMVSVKLKYFGLSIFYFQIFHVSIDCSTSQIGSEQMNNFLFSSPDIF